MNLFLTAHSNLLFLNNILTLSVLLNASNSSWKSNFLFLHHFQSSYDTSVILLILLDLFKCRWTNIGCSIFDLFCTTCVHFSHLYAKTFAGLFPLVTNKWLMDVLWSFMDTHTHPTPPLHPSSFPLDLFMAVKNKRNIDLRSLNTDFIWFTLLNLPPLNSTSITYCWE